MGGSSKQTIGYWYKYLLHYGLCRGPVDALLEMRVGDRTAFSGRITNSAQVYVDKLALFGGEKGEGGLQGHMDIMMGESDQAPNSYLGANMGPQQSGYRAKLSVLWRGGKFGAMNPYPKPVAFKVERILADWPDGAPWYPEKARIVFTDDISTEVRALAMTGSETVASPDGSDWDAAPHTHGFLASNLVALPDRYVAWAGGELARYTLDGGQSWGQSAQPVGVSGGTHDGVYFKNVLLFGSPSSGLYYTEDGAQTIVNLPFPAYPRLGYLGATAGVVVGFGNSDNNAYYASSPTGPWIEGAAHGLTTGLGATAAGGGGVIKFGASTSSVAGTPKVVSTSGGLSFSIDTLPVFASARTVRKLHFGGGIWVLGTDSGEMAFDAGAGWRLAADVLGGACEGLTHDGARFIACGSFGIATSLNGDHWEAVGLHPLAIGSAFNSVAALPFGEFTGGLSAMNPAHMIYESIIARVEDGGQGEPVGLISDASFRAAADTLYAEGFGLCTTWDGEETAEEFQDRVCNVIGASLSQSRVDGLYYLDLIRDSYVPADLPIISEDDVIEFVEEPTNLSEAINQAQVGWFDPTAKENRVTPPLSSLGGIQAAGGVIAASFTHREIPVENIAMRVAARYLAMKSRPMSRYTLTTNRRPYALRPGKFFRLQMPSEGVADVVCLAGEIDYGELGNGRMKIVAVQDVFGLPSAVFVDTAPGLDTGVNTTPVASANQRAFEAPYVEIAAAMSRADLAAMPTDVGYLATVATRPSGMGLNYAVFTAAASEAYVERGRGEWCPSALVVEAAAPLTTAFTITGGSDLAEVAVGSWALWGDEIVRVDAIDETAGTLTLGRGCADTVPPSPGHAAGTRIYFAGDWLGADGREYVDGELVHAKLLTRTTSELLALASAPANDVTMDQRALRPYPPGGFTINTEAYPATAFGLLSIGGVGRDRELQADQLLDTTAAAVGPETGTTYTIRYYANGVLEHTAAAIATLPSTYTPVGDCLLRIELEAVRDGLASWQCHSHELSYTTIAPSFLLLETGEFLLLESGDKLKLE